MSLFTLVDNGLVLLDDFNRVDNADPGNDWREDARPSQATTFQIDDGSGTPRLDSNGTGVNQVYQEGASGDPNPLGAGDKTFQVNVDFGHGGGTGRVQLAMRTSEIVDGASMDQYSGFLDSSSDESSVSVFDAGSQVQQDFTASNGPGPNIRAIRLVLEESGADIIMRLYTTADLDDLDDMAKAFTLENTVTDSTSPHTYVDDTTDYAILATIDALFMNAQVCGRGIAVSGLPTGWKASGNGGTTKHTESGGTATIDTDLLALPVLVVTVYNGADVLQGTFNTTVYGGASITFDGLQAAVAAGTTFKEGFNFRNTEGFVTDGADEQHVTSADVYPITRNGATFGWDVAFGPVPGHSDRDSGVDAKFAGSATQSNVPGTPAGFRVDVPGRGWYRIRLAVGNTQSSSGQYKAYIHDGVSKVLVADIDNGLGAVNANVYLDTSDTKRNEADWTDDNTEFLYEITTGSVYVVIGNKAAGSAITHLAHCSVELVQPPVAATAFARGFNFRGTSGFVTDDAGQTYVVAGDTYPTVRDGFTFGWDALIVGAQAGVDADSGIDVRFAGVVQRSNAGAVKPAFRLDLPGSGTYRIRCALGSTSSSQVYRFITFRDGLITVLADVEAPVGTTANNYMDATEVIRTEAAWPADNEHVDVVVTENGHLYVFIGNPDDNSEAGFTMLAHFSIELQLDDALAEGNAMQSGLRYAAIHPLRRQ